METENGKIEWYFLPTIDKSKLYVAYKGIPYAALPVGHLRFHVSNFLSGHSLPYLLINVIKLIN